MSVLRNGHLTQLTPAEARKRAEAALGAYRAAISRRHSRSADSGNSGNSGNSGTSTGIQVPAPAATWVVGCYVHGAPGHPPVSGNTGNSGNSGASGNS